MYETIKARYGKGYVTDEQLGRYVSLGVLTESQAEEIKGVSTATPEDAVPTAELDAAYREGVESGE